MSAPTPSIIDTRRHQMFPTLEPAEIERVRRFGEVTCYGTGEALAGRLLLVDALTMQLRTIRFAKDPACPVCGRP